MAEQEQVERLRRSVDEWNQWREQHLNVHPNLSWADLSGADLSGADLTGTDLTHARLIGADLTRARLNHIRWSNGISLSGADLTGADLTHARLIGAKLGGAKLIFTDLSQADLSGAQFNVAQLYGTKLSGANLAEALFGDTVFIQVDLSLVKGLDTAIHNGSSTVDIKSVTLPQDETTRLHFLRGVGFTETQIEYLPSLLAPRPIQYHSLFISYASQDEVLAEHLYADLRKNDVPCWFALHDLQPGNYFRERIDQAIHKQDKVLLLLSEHSVKSGWVRYEVELALARENREQREILFPVRLDDAIFHCTAHWATSLQATRHIGNFTSWQDDGAYQQAFTPLLKHLKVSEQPTM